MTSRGDKCGSVGHFLTDFLLHPHEEAQLAASFLETDKMTALKQSFSFVLFVSYSVYLLVFKPSSHSSGSKTLNCAVTL